MKQLRSCYMRLRDIYNGSITKPDMAVQLTCATVSLSVPESAGSDEIHNFAEKCAEPLIKQLEIRTNFRTNLWIDYSLFQFLFESRYLGLHKRILELTSKGSIEFLGGALRKLVPGIALKLLQEEFEETDQLFKKHELPAPSSIGFCYSHPGSFTNPQALGRRVFANSSHFTGGPFYPLGHSTTLVGTEGHVAEVNFPFVKLESTADLFILTDWIDQLTENHLVLAHDLVSYRFAAPESRRSENQAIDTTATDLPFRIVSSTRRYLALSEKFRSHGAGPAQRERLRLASAFLRRAHTVDAVVGITSGHPQLREDAIRSLISADVEMDYTEFPEVDPTVGWVHFQPTSEHESITSSEEQYATPVVVDTQLSRIYFSSSDGRILEYDYKPRKVDLMPSVGAFSTLLEHLALNFDALSSDNHRAELNEGLKSPENLTHQLLRASPDFLTTRFIRAYRDFESVIDAKIKAGVSAFLASATTGLEFEYWLNRFLPGSFHTLSFLIRLPTLDPNSIFPRALTSAGGVSSMLLPTNESRFIGPAEIEGGLHGLRLIDTIAEMSVDIRSAKQLNAVRYEPIRSSSGVFSGISVEVSVEAKRIDGDDRSNTIFISVVS